MYKNSLTINSLCSEGSSLQGDHYSSGLHSQLYFCDCQEIIGQQLIFCMVFFSQIGLAIDNPLPTGFANFTPIALKYRKVHCSELHISTVRYSKLH